MSAPPHNSPGATRPDAAEPRAALRVAILCAGILLPQFILYAPSLLGAKILLPLDILMQGSLYLPIAPEFKPYLPSNAIMSDEVLVIEPWREFAVQEVRAGRLPLWNPYNNCGSPFLAANQSALFSPFRILDYLFPGTLIIAWTQVVKSLVAGTGAYLFFRRALGVSFWPAICGAWAFPLTGFLVSWQGYPLSFVVTWLPWVLLGVNRAIAQPRGYGGLLLALATMALLLSGHAAMAAQVLLGAGLYALFCLGRVWGPGLLRPGVVGSLVALVLGWTLGAALSAPQTLPTFQYMRFSARLQNRQAGFEETPPAGLQAVIQFLLPDIYGSERRGSAYLISGQNRLESASTGYAGFLMALVFAPLAFARRAHRAEAVFWLLLAVLAAGQVLGLPLLHALFRQFPLSVLRNNRFVFLTGWSILTLGVLGLESLFRDATRWRWLGWLPIAACVLIIGYCGFRLLTPQDIVQKARGTDIYYSFLFAWLTGILLAAGSITLWLALRSATRFTTSQCLTLGILAVVEILWFAVGVNPQLDPQLYYPALPAITAIQQAPPGRACGDRCLQPALLLPARLRDLRGYDGVDPVHYLELIDCFRAHFPTKVDVPYAQLALISARPSPVLNLLNLRYILRRGVPTAGQQPFARGEDYYVLENPDCLPRAFVPRAVKTIADKKARLAALTDLSFNPREVAFTEVDLKLPGPSLGQAEIMRDNTGEVELAVTMETKGLLVLSDLWMPGWRAFDGDREVPIHRANHALRGVVLAPGQHRLTFRYEAPGFFLGLRLAAAGVVAGLVWCIGIAAADLRWPRK